jgi:pSer/pThr/pTyr-binding forkhead associated (FHA) protein
LSPEDAPVHRNSLEAFLHACGASAPLTLHVERQGKNERRPVVLNQPFAVIGSVPEADLTLTGTQVSKRHAYLQVIAGCLFCVDLGSRAGLTFEGEKKPSGWLQDQEVLGLGNYRLRLLQGSPKEAWERMGHLDPLASGSSQPFAMPAIRLELVKQHASEEAWRMNRLLALVGSAPECKVCIYSERVSRFHCSLVCTAQGVWVVDLLGRGGVLLNGKQVRFARVDDGDQLQLGRIALRLRYDAASLPQGLPLDGSAEQLALGETQAAVADLLPLVPAGADLVPVAAPQPLALSPASLASLALREAQAASGEQLAAALQGALPQGGPLEGLLLPLVSQFQLMQHQMFEQFQQAIVQMFQMFSALHQDQVGYLREELARLHQVTQELHALQNQLAQHPPPAKTPHETTLGAGSPSRERQAMPPKQPQPAPVQEKPKREAAPAGGSPAPPEVGEGSQDIHAWLSQRMAALQQERQGRWQKILDLLTGKR